MVASDIYTIAIELPQEELEKLCNMLKNDVHKKCKLKKKRKTLPEFKLEDGVQYLMENHFNKIRKP